VPLHYTGHVYLCLWLVHTLELHVEGYLKN